MVDNITNVNKINYVYCKHDTLKHKKQLDTNSHFYSVFEPFRATAKHNLLQYKFELACFDYKFQENAYLKQINVSWNGFDDDGGAAFGDALANNGFLTELDISSCRISTEGFGKLMCGLKSNEKLEVLLVFISFIRRRKTKVQHNMCWTPLYANKHI